MKTNAATYSNLLQRILGELAALEKVSKKAYTQIRKLSYSPELCKALHSEQTGIEDHLGRLKLIKTEIGKTVAKTAAKDIQSVNLSQDGKKGTEKDLWLTAGAQQLIQQKIALYKIAYRISLQLSLPHSPVLLEQTIKENEATSTWLDRIAQRILNGEIIIPEGEFK
ncbi:DUF892 family protein [Pedobacter ureilyticus]|uniref:DUF892 family protein n=1 Tax=Pedobacter ureilyticus TaxID=1393051 RepID=A0ABW9JEL8_9SPHI|nr:DUF892 family protein [Pedobacter helvus]